MLRCVLIFISLSSMFFFLPTVNKLKKKYEKDLESRKKTKTVKTFLCLFYLDPPRWGGGTHFPGPPEGEEKQKACEKKVVPPPQLMSPEKRPWLQGKLPHEKCFAPDFPIRKNVHNNS